MRRARSIAADIKAADDAYRRAVDAAAVRLTREHIAPYCMIHELHFTAGMGVWTFHKPTEQASLPWCIGSEPNEAADEIPDKLRELLQLEVFRGQDLGSMAPDYHGVQP